MGEGVREYKWMIKRESLLQVYSNKGFVVRSSGLDKCPTDKAMRVCLGTYTRDIITIADTLGEQAIADFPSEN